MVIDEAVDIWIKKLNLIFSIWSLECTSKFKFGNTLTFLFEWLWLRFSIVFKLHFNMVTIDNNLPTCRQDFTDKWIELAYSFVNSRHCSVLCPYRYSSLQIKGVTHSSILSVLSSSNGHGKTNNHLKKPLSLLSAFVSCLLMKDSYPKTLSLMFVMIIPDICAPSGAGI